MSLRKADNTSEFKIDSYKNIIKTNLNLTVFIQEIIYLK